MKARKVGALVISLLALGACSRFRSKPAVEINSGDVDLGSRWSGSLTTPSNLAGALAVRGTAWMAPGRTVGSTRAYVSISNAPPGAVYPWHVHRGQCGNDQGIVGPTDAYKPLRVEGDGRATAEVTVPVETPRSGDYFVNVHASPDNLKTIVACGNLAPPPSPK